MPQRCWPFFPGTGRVRVRARMGRAAISAVNWAEVVQKSLAKGLALEALREGVKALGVAILPFDAEDAETAARLWEETRRVGLSPGDRACLALALRLGVPALTADPAWSRLRVGVMVEVVR